MPSTNPTQSTVWSKQQGPQPPQQQGGNKPVNTSQPLPAIVPINYDQMMSSKSSTVTSPPSQTQVVTTASVPPPPPPLPPSLASAQSAQSRSPSSDSDQIAGNRVGSNPSPNAVLYQKLLELVSTSADLANQSELSTQMSTLLSNPNIKARLKQLHTQLLKDPNEYWPKLENILLDDSKLQKQMNNGNGDPNSAAHHQKDQIKITQDLIDLKNFYSKEYFNNNNNVNSTMNMSNTNNSNSNYYAKTQPRIINREIKK